MKTNIWMPLYVNDFVGKTDDLDAEESGVYLLLLMKAWSCGPLENNIKRLKRSARCDSTEVVEEILSRYFKLEDDGWHNNRIDEERDKAEEKAERARENGKKGGRPKSPEVNLEKTQPVNSGFENNNPEKSSSQSQSQSQSDTTYKEEIGIVVSFLNDSAGKAFKPGSKATKAHISARLRDGFTVEDMEKVITYKVKQWRDDPKMCEFIRPDTLFGPKMESYLNAIPKNSTQSTHTKQQSDASVYASPPPKRGTCRNCEEEEQSLLNGLCPMCRAKGVK